MSKDVSSRERDRLPRGVSHQETDVVGASPRGLTHRVAEPLSQVMPLLEGGSCAYAGHLKNFLGHPRAASEVMRAAGGQSMGFEDESVIAYILREVAKAVKYFHDNMQIHRDLKAGNILLSLDARVRPPLPFPIAYG